MKRPKDIARSLWRGLQGRYSGGKYTTIQELSAAIEEVEENGGGTGGGTGDGDMKVSEWATGSTSNHNFVDRARLATTATTANALSTTATIDGGTIA